MAEPDSFSAFLLEQLAPLGHIAPRRMFGAIGLFHQGVMFAIIADDALYVRVDDGNRDELREAAAEPPLNYTKRGKVIDLSFWRVAEPLLDDRDTLLVWARSALGAARRVAAKRPAKRRRVG